MAPLATEDSLGSSSTCEDVAEACPAGAAQMAESTVIVTGANTGIGAETAKQLAKLGAHVVLACRSEAKAEEARKAMISEDAALEGRVVFLALDLGDLESVSAFASAFLERAQRESWPPLRCLILNAGIFPTAASRSKQGFEMCFAVNHLAHFALTQALLPTLRRNAPSRVVVVASGSHYAHKLTKTLENKEEVKEQIALKERATLSVREGADVYAASKLCNVAFAQELSRREAANGVAACSLHPGTLIATDIARDFNMVVRFLYKYVLSNFTKSINQGASTTLLCALTDHERLQGAYFDSCQRKPASRKVTPEGAAALWELSEELLASGAVADSRL